MPKNEVGTVLSGCPAWGWVLEPAGSELAGSTPTLPGLPESHRLEETLRMREETRTGAQAFKGRRRGVGAQLARRGGACPGESAPRSERRATGTSGRRPPGEGTRQLSAPAAGPQLPSLLALRFPGAPPPRHKAKERGRAVAEPAPFPASDWLPQLSILNLFLMGGVPPSLPQITFATSSQPVGPKSAGKKRLGASKFSPTVPRPGPPRLGPRR